MNFYVAHYLDRPMIVYRSGSLEQAWASAEADGMVLFVRQLSTKTQDELRYVEAVKGPLPDRIRMRPSAQL